MKSELLSIGLLMLVAARVEAWPAETMAAIGRDACRVMPRSLGRLIAEREREVRQEVDRFPAAVSSAVARDVAAGRLSPATLALLDGEIGAVVELFRARQVSEGLVRLGGLLRIPADLSDPVLADAPETWPPALAPEYYALFAANLDKMPVVLDPSQALELKRSQLPQLFQALAERSRQHRATIRAELFRDGRVLRHETLDYRSPAWAVASLSYSRAVTATAAVWLAVWREARGDTSLMRRPHEVAPREPAATARNDRRPPQPEVP